MWRVISNGKTCILKVLQTLRQQQLLKNSHEVTFEEQMAIARLAFLRQNAERTSWAAKDFSTTAERLGAAV